VCFILINYKLLPANILVILNPLLLAVTLHLSRNEEFLIQREFLYQINLHKSTIFHAMIMLMWRLLDDDHILTSHLISSSNLK